MRMYINFNNNYYNQKHQIKLILVIQNITAKHYDSMEFVSDYEHLWPFAEAS